MTNNEIATILESRIKRSNNLRVSLGKYLIIEIIRRLRMMGDMEEDNG